MIRSHYFHITLLILLFGNSLFGQNDARKITRADFTGEMTNDLVIDAKFLHHQGETEKSLKKGLEILASNIQLSAIDSFYTYQVLAYNFRDLGTNSLALEHAKKAVAIMQRMEPNKGEKISWIAPYYSDVRKFDSAIVYMKKNIPYFTKNGDTLALLKLYNDIGFTHSLNNEPDLAIEYYNKVIQFESKNEKFNAIIGLATGNLGTIYLSQGEYEKALVNIKIDAAASKESDKVSYYNAMNAIGECYYLLGNYSAAKNTLQELLGLNHTEQRANLRTYYLLADVYAKTKESDKSAFYLRKYMSLKDSLQKNEVAIETIFEQLSAAKIAGIKTDLELAKNKTKSEEFKNHVFLIALILSLVFVVIAIVYYRNRQRKNTEIQKLETRLIKSELKNKKKDLTNMVTNLGYKRKFIDEVQEKLKHLHNLPADEVNEEITVIIREFNNYKNADKNSAVLQTDLDKVNLSFFEKLGELFPDLTEKEKELCGFLLLKLSTKDIASLRNITPNAVKKARQRIRKKLPISESEELTAFLENI